MNIQSNVPESWLERRKAVACSQTGNILGNPETSFWCLGYMQPELLMTRVAPTHVKVHH
jgi:hypothetical protein